jgi:hypothetical protein
MALCEGGGEEELREGEEAKGAELVRSEEGTRWQ